MLAIVLACLAVALMPVALVVLAGLVTALVRAAFIILVSPVLLAVWLTDKVRGKTRRYL